MKTKTKGRFYLSLILFGLLGQIAWVVENMYLNVFIYNTFRASAGDIRMMVSASAVAATLTTVFMGALSDKIGKRKSIIVVGYLLWGLSVMAFGLVRLEWVEKIAPAASAAFVGAVIVVVLLIRLYISRLPRIFSYALWGIVLVRLLCPVSLPSPFSLMNTSKSAISSRPSQPDT